MYGNGNFDAIRLIFNAIRALIPENADITA
jgi:hypothetical protein